jgi:steroid delta-isomerase
LRLALGRGKALAGKNSMTHEEADTFAAGWAEAWNQRAVEQVLEHFHDEVVFTSPTALAVVGVPTVHGKEALRSYWLQALARVNSLHFTVERTLWDAERRELAIVYTSAREGQTRRISENLTFDAQGLVVSAEVFHGVSGASAG